jgi:transposase-like protein
MASQATTIQDLNGLMRLMMKSALERMLDTEMDVHLGRRPDSTSAAPPAADPAPATDAAVSTKRPPNRRNGRSQKTVQGDQGELTIATPRDRAGTFEPQLIGKHQRRVPGFDEKILALYAKGMTTRDIQDIVQQLYDVEVSATLISEITADLDAEATTWRTRPLEPVWPIVYFDGIVVHVRGANGRVTPHTVYVALGVNLEGHKELLGLWLGENEGAKFWLACLTDLRNRGLRDIFVACIDGLSGFAEAIHAAYPQATVQLCIVHLVRAALRYVSTLDSKAVIADLKAIYQAATIVEAEQALDKFAQAWDANIRRSPRRGAPSGPTSSRCSTTRRRFVGRSTRPTPSNRSTV